MDDKRVAVRYRGIELAANAPLLHIGPTTAFLALAAPMPVGTELTLRGAAGDFAAIVVRVHEAVAEQTSGVRVVANLDRSDIAGWWQTLVCEDDWVSARPMPMLAAEAASDTRVAAVSATPPSSHETPVAGDSGPTESNVGVAKAGKRRGSRKRKTRS